MTYEDALAILRDGWPITPEDLTQIAARIWDEAYRRGVDDARIADDLRVDVGLGPDLYAQPARQNPYRASEGQ